jgi:hypothetical protein
MYDENSDNMEANTAIEKVQAMKLKVVSFACGKKGENIFLTNKPSG